MHTFNKCGQQTHLQCNEAVEDLPQNDNEAGSPEPLATSACSQRSHRWPALHSDSKIFVGDSELRLTVFGRCDS